MPLPPPPIPPKTSQTYKNQVISQFCLLAVVGMLLGIAFGAATSWLLDNIFRDPTLTTVVTLVSAYASYYTADRLVGASGLLAVVCNGFSMSLMGGCRFHNHGAPGSHGGFCDGLGG